MAVGYVMLNKLNVNFNKNININSMLLYIKYVLKAYINLKIIYIITF